MYCSNCGAEINDEMKFCPNCGKEIQKAKEEKNDNSENEDNDNSIFTSKPKFASGCAFIVFVVIIALIILAGIAPNEGIKTSDNTEAETEKPACPSKEETEMAVFQYVNSKIIKKIDGQLNTVWVTEAAEAKMGYEDLQTLGFIAACYSSYEKNYDLVWADIKSWRTNKTIAKYSKTYGFQMKK